MTELEPNHGDVVLEMAMVLENAAMMVVVIVIEITSQSTRQGNMTGIRCSTYVLEVQRRCINANVAMLF